jgi:transposase
VPKTRLVTVSSLLRIIGPEVVTATPEGAQDVVMSGVRCQHSTQNSTNVEVVLGVDTHLDFHVAVVLDDLGRYLGELRVPTTTKGYTRLLCWAEEFGVIRCAGVEGTSSCGAGLVRYLTSAGIAVAEVERPKRRHLRRNGKSDPLDAEAAARAVLAGETAGTPKSADGHVEMIRALRTARRSAVKARGQAANQLQALVVTAPDALRDRLRWLSTRRLVAVACRLRPSTQPETPEAASKLALRSVARRHEALSEKIAELDVQLDRLVAQAAPELLALPAVGTDHAATLLIVAGDNPQRLRGEASFASLCGVSPVEASSGKVVRHRPNRDANRALHMICMLRMGMDGRTQQYVARRTAEGKSKREILRCLKRYVAREIYRVLVEAVEAPPLTTASPAPTSKRISVMA